ASALELPLVERDEVVPLLLLGEVVDEDARGLRMAGRQVEDVLVRRHGAVDRAELLLQDAREPGQRRELLVLRRDLGGERLERRRELFPALLALEDPLEQERRAAVLRIEGERLAEEPDDLLEQIATRVLAVLRRGCVLLLFLVLALL